MNYTNKFFYSLLLLTNYSHSSKFVNNCMCSKKTEYSVSNFIGRCSAHKAQKNMSDENFKYESGSCSIAFVTAPDDKIAKKLARGLIEMKLAACVNIIPNIQSVYMWDGKLNEDNEYMMMIKTRTSRLEELTKWVRDNHPYSVAEVITTRIEQGNLPYMKWLSETVPNK